MRARLGTALTTAALIVLASLGVVGSPAGAAGSGSITGTVTVPDGYDVRAVQVFVLPSEAVNGSYAGTDWTDSSGAFAVTGLPDGTYYVGFGTYWSDMNPCDGRDRWWSGAGDPAGTCRYEAGGGSRTMTGTQAVTVAGGSATALGTVPVLGTYPTYEVTGKLVAPPGESVAGMKVELWVDDENWWINEISGGWYRLTSVPVRTVDASGTFTFTLPEATWSTYSALRVVDAGHGYTFSFSNGGLTQDTAGLGGADFGNGSVGLQRLPWWTYPDTDLGNLQLKHEISHVSGGATITGSPEWGRTLTASSTAVWSHPGVGTDFQWVRNGAVLDGATGPTYVLNDGDDGWGAAISVRAVPKGPWAYNGAPVESPAVTTTNTTPLNVSAPTVKGSPVVGQQLTATTGAWRPTYPTYTYSYQWLRGSTAVAGATAATYTLTAKDLGQRISVRVSADRVDSCGGCDPWFTGPGVARSGATAAVVLPTQPATWVAKWPVKTATKVRGGKRIAVGKAVVGPAGKARGVRLTYQWFVGGKAVRGAIKPSLTVKRAWKRKAVVVRVIASAPGYQSRYRVVGFGKVR